MAAEEEIINDAVYNLKRLTGLKDIEFQTGTDTYGYNVAINGMTFACEVRKFVNKANYNLIVQHMRKLRTQTKKPLMLAARHIVPDIIGSFRREGINVVEGTGNCDIADSPLFIHISGQKDMQPKESKGMLYSEAGLKLIFYFLLDVGNISSPYRMISQETCLSLGTIKNVIEELQLRQHIITCGHSRSLRDWRELLDLWQACYNQTLKPKLFVKEMEFADAASRKEWETLALPKGMCWGGEGGAYLTDRYLVPEQFDIYTDVPSVNLAMTRRVRFQEGGSIRIYRKFWKSAQADRVAPRILLYADMMGSGNSRCIEAAQRLIGDGIQDNKG